MAGYIFLLDDMTALETCVKQGVYSTRLKTPNGYWKTHHEATFADYVTMQKGDNIYFFIKRKIYGVGEIINLQWHDRHGGAFSDCKFLNYPDAYKPVSQTYRTQRNKLLFDFGAESAQCRWLCLFKSQPYFFRSGIDMDEVLASDPAAFKILRVMQGVSFIKFDDSENQAFKNALLKFNQHALNNPSQHDVFENNQQATHITIASRLSSKYILKAMPFMDICHAQDALKHEMAIEVGLLQQLTTKNARTVAIFGEWDYLSHQVVASPFKPVIYMDKMDIFGYSYIKGHKPTRSTYLVIEIKKGKAKKENIDQLMKYVDWVQEEYCHNDYSMINAFLVAHSFSDDVIAHKNSKAIRMYTVGTRPAESHSWAKMQLVEYSYNGTTKSLDFLQKG